MTAFNALDRFFFMPLDTTHKDFIKSTISYLFDLPDSNIAALHTETVALLAATTHHSKNQYEPFSRVFYNPNLLSRIDDCGPLTLGEAREYMLEYVSGKISNAALAAGTTAEALGWNHEAIRKAVQNRPDHTEPLISKHIATTTWEWWDLQKTQTQHSPTPSETALPSLTCEEIQKGLKSAIRARDALKQALLISNTPSSFLRQGSIVYNRYTQNQTAQAQH